jgi:hypothetical protein
MAGTFIFPRNLEKQRAMMRISIHQRNNDITDITRQMHSTLKVLQRIYLYMPTSIQYNDGLTYENVDLSSLLGVATDIVALAKNGATGQDVSDRKDVIQTQIIGRASGSGGLLGGAASQALIKSGQVVNPRTQMLFKGPVLRQFSFQYKLIPSNKQEAEDIYEMIKTIRAHAHPQTKGLTSETESTFIFPDIFRIEMVTNTGESSGGLKMARIADTYCTAISTNYNPTSNAFYAGGYPSEIDLGLTFQETKTISRTDIEGGY